MNRHTFEIHTLFSEKELFALKAFYSGTRARQIQPKYGDPWAVVYRHRHLPQDLYEAVKWALVALSLPAPEQKLHDRTRPTPRWQRCPHCSDWIERDAWRPRCGADSWLGHKSGCWPCFEARVARYHQNREAGHA